MRFGYEAETAHLLDRTVELIRRSGFREYFNPITGQGMGARNFGVTTIAIDCIARGQDGIPNRLEVA
jgi:hypothetical protein